MGTRSIRWPLIGLCLLTVAACVLVAAGGYLLLRHRHGGAPRPGHAGTSVDVVAAYPGASAEEVERQVVIPLEVTFAGVPGLKFVGSKAQLGRAFLRLEFESRVDYWQARQEVINRLQFTPALPPGVSPVLSPAEAGQEILLYALCGPRGAHGEDLYTPADLRTLHDWVLEREFRRVPRVAGAVGSGGAVTRYEVHLDPDRLRRHGISLRQVQTALAESNANVGGDTVLAVRSVGLLGGGEDPVQGVLGLKDPREAAARLRGEEQRRLREIRSLVLATVNGVPVHLEDVIEGGRLAAGEEVGRKGVVLGRQPGSGRAGLARPGEPDQDDAVLGVVFLRPGEGRQAALDDVKARVREINDTPGRLLPGVRLEPLWYRTARVAEDCLTFRAGLPANTSPQAAAEQMRQARAVLLRRPEVRAVVSEVGPQETEGARVLILFHPEEGRPPNRQRFVDDVQAELSRSLPGIDWGFLPDGVDDFRVEFDATPGAGLLKIFGPDSGELERLAGKARAQLQKVEGVSDVHVPRVRGGPRLELVVDADKCARWGVSVADVNNVLALAAGGRRATQMIEGEKIFDLTLLWPEPQRRDTDRILDLPLDVIHNTPAPGQAPAAAAPRLRLRDVVSPRGADGHPDPKGAFVRPGIAAIWREQGQRMIAVCFRIRNRKGADVVAEAEKTLAPLFSAPYRAEWSVGADAPF